MPDSNTLTIARPAPVLSPSLLARTAGLARVHPWSVAAMAVGLGVRLALMPTASYGDLHAIAYALRFLAFDGVIDVYSEIRSIPYDHTPLPTLAADFFPYPPLAYLILGGAMAVLRPLYGESFAIAVALPYSEFAGHPQAPLWLFLYKLPLLIADLAVAGSLASLGREPGQRLRLAALWALNPIPIIATYLFGQFDVLPTLALVLALRWVARGRAMSGAAALGLSAALKLYSLLLIPVFTLVAGKTLRGRLGLGAVALAIFGATFLPLAGDPLALPVVFGSEPVQRAAASGVAVGQVFEHSGVLSLVFLSYTFLLLYAASRVAGSASQAHPYMLAVLLLTYGFTFGHLQWFTTAAALLTIDWEEHPDNRLVQVVLYGCALLVASSWQVGGFLDFFQPVFSEVSLGEPALKTLIPEEVIPAVVGAARSGFTGAALFWVYVNVLRPGRPDLL